MALGMLVQVFVKLRNVIAAYIAPLNVGLGNSDCIGSRSGESESKSVSGPEVPRYFSLILFPPVP